MSSFFYTRKLQRLVRNTLKVHKLCHSTMSTARTLILGIETSCDDTGCAVVDTAGNILGEALNSQHQIHLDNGGIIPPIARDLHRQNIEQVVETAVHNAGVDFRDISAIATTVKPGLPLSLLIGTKYGKHLCRTHKKPFIPIHHMEAHALTARMHDPSLEFPFLVLLISGGHCLLAVARSVSEFLTLGSSIDDAPGEAFDKMARRMKMKNLAEFSQLSGGQAIEMAARRADDPLRFKFQIPMLGYKDCNFSLSGVKNQLQRHLYKEERQYDVPPDGVIPDLYNLCAGFQLVVTRHLCHRVQRAMVYCQNQGLLPSDHLHLVVSGGAACNDFIATGLQIVCNEMGYKLTRPPPKLCTDNGVMIAWNGVEKWRQNLDVLENFEHVDIEGTCPLGTSLAEHVAEQQISCKWVRLSRLNQPLNRKSDLF